LRLGDPSQIGRYRLTARLGSGGMGVVYLGEAVSPAQGAQEAQRTPGGHGSREGYGGQVAVKVLRPELADDPELRERFGREVTTLVRVRGVCTVRVIEADTEAAQPFLVTEYADGPSLAEYVDVNGPLGADMLYGLATGLAEALTAIHATGVAHRDLKPSNVLLSPSGPKVIDFGIAQVLDATSVTKTGMTVGSAGFMAPEQITGRAGTAADIFAWAVTIGYAASGHSPFGTGTSHAVMYRILHAEPSIEAVPAALRAHVAAALAKDPESRPSAPELLSQLTSTSGPELDHGDDSPTQTVLLRTWRPATASQEIPAHQPARHADHDARHAAHQPARHADRPPSVRRRPALRTVALSLAVLLATAGAVLGFTLAGRPAPIPATALQATATPTRERPLTRPIATRPDTPATRPAATPSSPSPSPRRKATPSTSATPAKTAAAASAALPVLTVGDYAGTKPSQIAFSADSGNVVTGIVWTSWTASGATGYGNSDVDICLPTCVQTPANVVQATIVMSDPVNGRFTQLTETRYGSTVTYSYPAPWPISASQ
jgi:serine/threonine protein kinase